jgi:nucleotide-binding universal stress UspA family protein
MIRRILVGLSGPSQAEALVPHAIDVAARHGAALTGAATVDLAELENVGPVPLGGGAAASELREHRVQTAIRERDAAVATLALAAEAAGVACRIVAAEGPSEPLLVDLSRYHDLTLLPLPETRGDEPADAPEELVRLISHGVRPILAVAVEPRPIERILVAYSGSMESAKAMKHLVQLRPWPDAALRVVTFGQAEDERRQLLDQAAEYCAAHGFAVETDWVDGAAQAELLSYAQGWGADLIVAGNSGRSLLARKILGDTALELLRQADRSLFLAQ